MTNNDLDANGKRIETDTSKLIQRHLADKNDQIKEEDLRNIRILTELPPQAVTTTGAEVASLTKLERVEEPNDRPITPWDVVS